MKDKKDKKRMNNKGFSFVELIIAIAILAIMAGVLAPQLIKYIDSSRKSTDVQNAQAIATAVNIALANEDAYNAAKTKAVANSNKAVYKLSDLSGTVDEDDNSVAGDMFEEKVLEVIVNNKIKPKYNSSTYDDFVIIIYGGGTSLSFKIYPSTNEAYHSAENELYPNVGTNYTK